MGQAVESKMRWGGGGGGKMIVRVRNGMEFGRKQAREKS